MSNNVNDCCNLQVHLPLQQVSVALLTKLQSVFFMWLVPWYFAALQTGRCRSKDCLYARNLLLLTKQTSKGLCLQGRCNSDPSQRSVTVMISDVCPECEANHMDIQALTYNKVDCPS